MGARATNHETEQTKKQTEDSHREYEIDGKKFAVIRHFAGGKPLQAIITELAVNRANQEMGL